MARGRTVDVVLRVKPRQDVVSDEITVMDNEKGATVILKKDSSSGELFQYGFSRALENVPQEEFFEVCGSSIVDSCLEGYNGTILAYGQTGSGKTYTMLGPEGADLKDTESQGIIPRTIKKVFDGCKRSTFISSLVKMTYVEVYNETFNDLLTQSKDNITVQEAAVKNGSGMTSLKGCNPVVVQTEAEAMDYLFQGQKMRKVAAHSMNARSSRSHTVLTLWIEMTTESGRVFRSKLNLVDLAGSERLNKTGAVGTVAKEATFINKSLSCLAMVVKELKKKSAHVRYRDSKLTHYLKDSLGGNCRTLMVACIWGDSEHLQETLSTCRFAEEIQQVEVTAEKNNGMDSVHGNLFKLNPAMMKYIDQMTAKRVAQEKAKLYKELKSRGLLDMAMDGHIAEEDEEEGEEQDELELLRTRVKQLESAEANNLDDPSGGGHSVEEVKALKKKVADLEEERQKIQAEMACQMHEAECALLSEMQCLREKVCELQKFRTLSKSESLELQALRERMREMEDRKSAIDYSTRKYNTWHPGKDLYPRERRDSYDLKKVSTGSTTGEVQHLQISVKFTETHESISRGGGDLTSRASISSKQETVGQGGLVEQARILEELEVMRDRLKSLHSVAVGKLNQENLDELAAIKGKILDLQQTEQDQRYCCLAPRDRQQSLSNGSLLCEENLRGIQSPQGVVCCDNCCQVDTNTLPWDPRHIWDSKREWPHLHHHPHKSVDQDGLLTFRSAYTVPRVQSPRRRRHPEFPCEFDQTMFTSDLKEKSIINSQDVAYSVPYANSWYRACEDRYGTEVTQSDLDSSISAPDFYSSTNCHSYSASPILYDKKPSFGKKLSMRLGKLMTFRKPQSYEHEETDTGGNRKEDPLNIVILNSLTHDQLMEMLKARHASKPSYDATGSADNIDSPYLYDSYAQMDTWLKEIPPSDLVLDPSAAPSPLPLDLVEGKW